MTLNEIIAESMVSRLSTLLKKKVIIADQMGSVLASTDLAETNKNYEQLHEAVKHKKEIEVAGPATPNTLPSGLIVPIIYSKNIVGSLFIEDSPAEYRHYRHIIPTTVELLMHQNLVTDNFPYKDKIKDNFVFGLLHRKISAEDSKVREEADLLDINLSRDKVLMIISVEGFWHGIFGDHANASEDEKQTRLSHYKKKIFQACSQFFGRLSGCSVSYFGSDTFVVLLDELYSIDGREMVEMMRTKHAELHKIMSDQFEKGSYKRLLIGISSFYRGKDGAVMAYEEARRALHLGLSLGHNKPVYHIDDLGMIATLAEGNKKWQDNFVRRILMKLLAEEYLLETVEVFFDQNMSLTQTSKQLNIHRNTLLYRLEKIKKVTGLDPRKFNDAMELKVALILNRVLYLEKPAIKTAV